MSRGTPTAGMNVLIDRKRSVSPAFRGNSRESKALQEEARELKKETPGAT